MPCSSNIVVSFWYSSSASGVKSLLIQTSINASNISFNMFSLLPVLPIAQPILLDIQEHLSKSFPDDLFNLSCSVFSKIQWNLVILACQYVCLYFNRQFVDHIVYGGCFNLIKQRNQPLYKHIVPNIQLLK